MTHHDKKPAKTFEDLEWFEHIRLRPGMYFGSINMKSFADFLKGLFSIVFTDLGTDEIDFELINAKTAKLTVNNIQFPVVDN